MKGNYLQYIYNYKQNTLFIYFFVFFLIKIITILNYKYIICDKKLLLYKRNYC